VESPNIEFELVDFHRHQFCMNSDMKTLTVAIVLVLSAAPLFSQESGEAVNEATVAGAPSLESMRAELERVEDVVYAIFNELNDDDAYDIICRRETRVGSQIRYRVCLASVLRDTVADDEIDDDAGTVTVSHNTSRSRHQKILAEKMRQLASENPELLEALKVRLLLKRRLEEERIRRHGE